jgi:hypothetical protein
VHEGVYCTHRSVYCAHEGIYYAHEGMYRSPDDIGLGPGRFNSLRQVMPVRSKRILFYNKGNGGSELDLLR